MGKEAPDAALLIAGKWGWFVHMLAVVEVSLSIFQSKA